MAWTFISAASNLCQTLGYHRLRSPRENDQPLRVAQERLFWTVYEIDKGLSFRLGRSSNIRDAEITLPFDGDAPRNTRLARIQGRVYDQLHSSAALSCLDNESGYTAEALAGEVRELIEEIRAELFVGFHCLESNCVSLKVNRRVLPISPASLKRIHCASFISSAIWSVNTRYLFRFSAPFLRHETS